MTTLTMFLVLTFAPFTPAPEAAPEMVCEEVATFDAAEFEAIPEIPATVEEVSAAPLAEEQDTLPLVSSVSVPKEELTVIAAKFEPKGTPNSNVVVPVKPYQTRFVEPVQFADVQPITSGRKAKVILVASAAVRPAQETNFGQKPQACEICVGRTTTSALIIEDPRMELVTMAKVNTPAPPMHFTPTVSPAPKREEETSIVEIRANGGLMEMLRAAKAANSEKFAQAKIKNAYNLVSQFLDKDGNKINAAMAMKVKKGDKLFLVLKEDPKGSRQLLSDMNSNIRT